MSINWEEVFQDFSNELEALDAPSFSIYCVGGFVLQYNELRGTMDVDAFYRADKAVEQAIYRVGEKHGINGVDELWLNNHVESLNPCPDAEHFQLAYNFPRLNVYVADLKYVLAMKLASGRDIDNVDIKHIIETLDCDDPVELSRELKTYDLPGLDTSELLIKFGEIYGADWLTNYIQEHGEALRAEF